jgi:N6-adenosine-specific RNA methylase IME4
VADPPWTFGDKLPGKKRGAAKNYNVLRTREIEAFLAERPGLVIAEDALLFLWRVSAMVDDAMGVARAWGFEPKAEIVWIKTERSGIRHFGLGRYVRNSHETCIIARRGKAKVRDRAVKSVFEAPIGEHSAKPEAFYHLVERLSGGPYMELFARRRRRGWSCFGDELDGEDQVPGLHPADPNAPHPPGIGPFSGGAE